MLVRGAPAVRSQPAQLPACPRLGALARSAAPPGRALDATRMRPRAPVAVAALRMPFAGSRVVEIARSTVNSRKLLVGAPSNLSIAYVFAGVSVRRANR